MTLDAQVQTTTPETPAPAPAPEAKAPPKPEILQEPQSESEKIEAAEREELRKVYRKTQAENPDEPEPEVKVKRDEKTGKFVALKEDVNVDDGEKAEKPPAAKEAKKEKEEPAPKAEDPKKPAIEPPKHWDDKRKAALAKLDPEEQEAFVKEFGELHKTATNHGRALKSLEPVVKVLQEHKDAFDKRGMSYDQGVAALLRAQARLENPATSRDAILALAREYNVDLGTPQTQDADDEWVDPNVQRLAQELANERERNNRIEQYLHGFAQQQKMQVAQAKEASMQGLIEQFAQGKDDFGSLEQEIIDRAQMIRAVQPQLPPDQVLARAYHEARLLSPVTQERVLSERERERAATAEKARRAAALNVQSEPDPSTATSDLELYRQVYRKHNAA